MFDEEIKKYDEDFDLAHFYTKVDHIFIMILSAIMERDISKVKHYLSNNVYEEYNKLINSYIEDKKITNNQGKEVFAKMIEENITPQEIVKKYGMEVIEDDNLIDALVSEVISENQKAIEDYKNGRTNMLDYMVGQVMKKSKGKANPVVAKEKLLKNI